MTTDNQHDPLESLLKNAFAAELARTEAPELNTQVLEQIRREQRVRGAALGVMTAVGLLLLVTIGLPALVQLGSLLSVPEIILARLGGVLPGIETLTVSAATLTLLLVIAPWLWAVVDDSV